MAVRTNEEVSNNGSVFYFVCKFLHYALNRSEWIFRVFASSTEEYCRTFDLTCRIRSSIVEGALQTGDHIRLEVDSPESKRSTRRIIRRIKDILNTEGEASSKPLRICIPSLGAPQWGDLNPQVV